MKSSLYILFFIFILFFAQNVMNLFGIDAKYIYAIYLVVAMCFIITNKNCIARRNKRAGILILITAAIGLLKMRLDASAGSRLTALNLMSAPIIFGCFPSLSSSPRFWNKAFKIIIVFFVVECSLALFERVTMINIFPWSSGDTTSNMIMMDSDEDVSSFRSFGLLGHPLQNALPVCTMMAFILCSAKMKAKDKALLWLLGYVAILCFNTRGSIVGAAMILGAYVLYQYFTNKHLSFAKKNFALFGIIIGAVGLFFVIMNFNLGGRLTEMGLFDEGSAQVRVDTWNIFNYFKLSDFLFGMNSNQRTMVLYSSGIWTTENFWIDYLMSIGLIALVLVIIAYFFTIKKLYHGYKKMDVLITLASFILIASTNNSLSASWTPLFIYLMTIYIYAFKEDIPYSYKRIIIKK